MIVTINENVAEGLETLRLIRIVVLLYCLTSLYKSPPFNFIRPPAVNRFLFITFSANYFRRSFLQRTFDTECQANLINMETLGQWLKATREAKGLLLRQVAAYLDIDQAILSKIEKSSRKPGRDHINNLSEIL